jgi:hypothetical protein
VTGKNEQSRISIPGETVVKSSNHTELNAKKKYRGTLKKDSDRGIDTTRVLAQIWMHIKKR